MNPNVPKLPCAFQMGSLVYHLVDGGAGAGIVTNIQFGMDGGVLFQVAWSITSNRWHYECELSTTRNWIPESLIAGGTATEP